MWYVYIIISKEGLSYTGITKNIEKRIISHNSGRNCLTKRGSNWKLLYSESHKMLKKQEIVNNISKIIPEKNGLNAKGIYDEPVPCKLGGRGISLPLK